MWAQAGAMDVITVECPHVKAITRTPAAITKWEDVASPAGQCAGTSVGRGEEVLCRAPNPPRASRRGAGRPARLPGDALAMGLPDLRPGALRPVRCAHVRHISPVQADK